MAGWWIIRFILLMVGVRRVRAMEEMVGGGGGRFWRRRLWGIGGRAGVVNWRERRGEGGLKPKPVIRTLASCFWEAICMVR